MSGGVSSTHNGSGENRSLATAFDEALPAPRSAYRSRLNGEDNTTCCCCSSKQIKIIAGAALLTLGLLLGGLPLRQHLELLFPLQLCPYLQLH